MTYEECTYQCKFELEYIFRNSYKGYKINYICIIPENNNEEYLIRQSIQNELNIDLFLEVPMTVYVVYDLEMPINEISKFRFERLETVLESIEEYQ
jgi:hypothetical protein